MKPLTKLVVYGGVATAIIGPALVAQATVSGLGGMGTFAAVLLEDGLPAAVSGFQSHDGGASGGLFGESAPQPQAPAVPPVAQEPAAAAPSS